MPRLLYAEAAISTFTAGARTGWIATVAIRRPSWHSLSQTHKNRWRTSHAWAVVRDHLYAARARLTSATAVRAAAREVRSGPFERKKKQTGTGLVHRSVAMRLIHIESISIAASCTLLDNYPSARTIGRARARTTSPYAACAALAPNLCR